MWRLSRAGPPSGSNLSPVKSRRLRPGAMAVPVHLEIAFPHRRTTTPPWKNVYAPPCRDDPAHLCWALAWGSGMGRGAVEGPEQQHMEQPERGIPGWAGL